MSLQKIEMKNYNRPNLIKGGSLLFELLQSENILGKSFT